MPTNAERREVAENLRSMCSRGCRYAERFYELLNDTVMREWDFHSFQDVADRLADLIEPEERTCRVVTDIRAFSQTQDMHVKSCSACGYVFGSEEHRQLLPGLDERVAIDLVVIPNYCPNCGTRVVKGDGE